MMDTSTARLIALAALTLGSHPTWVHAQDDALNDPVRIRGPERVNVGDPVVISIEVLAAKGDDVAVPTQALEPFEVLDTRSTTEPQPDDVTKHVFELELLALSPGEHQLGPIKVRMTTQAGELHSLETDTVTVEVASLIANEPNPEFMAETQPVSVEQDDYTLAWIAGALLAMILGGLLTWLFLRWWRRRDRPEAPPLPATPPWEIALRELRDLQRVRENMVGSGVTDQWVDSVSDVLRRYLGERFGFDGLESTTDEISHKLHRTALVGIEPTEAVSFLADCDLVKFAKAPLAGEASEELITEAFRLVEVTHRTVTEATPSGGAS